MKKARIYLIEKKLVTLKKIKCSPKIKRKLRKADIDWINWEKQHMEDVHRDEEGNYEFHSYHQGSIDMLKIFFNIKRKNEKKKE